MVEEHGERGERHRKIKGASGVEAARTIQSNQGFSPAFRA
jgi:hypothetical protein